MKFVTYFMSTLAYLLNELKSTPEGSGTLLDNCLIYYGTEMGEGYHTTKKMPVVLAGKAGGQVETGRHLAFPETTPLSRLFLSILQLGAVVVALSVAGLMTGRAGRRRVGPVEHAALA